MQILNPTQDNFIYIAVWNYKFAEISLKALCAVWSFQCIVWNVQMQVQVQVHEQCAMYTVLPAAGEDLEVEAGKVKN